MSQDRFDIQTAAVIGAGTMGRGIVMSLANAGVQVRWLDNNPEMLEQALNVVADTYAHNVRQGRIDETQAQARRACISKAAACASATRCHRLSAAPWRSWPSGDGDERS